MKEPPGNTWTLDPLAVQHLDNQPFFIAIWKKPINMFVSQLIDILKVYVMIVQPVKNISKIFWKVSNYFKCYLSFNRNAVYGHKLQFRENIKHW